MTRAHQDAHWSDAPSLSQLWLAALLRLVAMLVSNVAATVGMIASVLSGECHTDVDPADLPQPKHDPTRETEAAAGNSQTTNSSNSAAVLLPRAGEAQRARAAERQRSGGGRLHRSAVRAVPHRIVHAATSAHASLPRSGEEN